MAIVDFDTECWGDPWVQELPPNAKLLFVYLWTNVHRNIAGLYVITKETIAFDTKLPRAQLDPLFQKLFPKVQYDPDHSVCWVVKHARRQFLRGGKISPRQRQGIRRHALKLKWHPFFKSFLEAYPELFSEDERDTLSMGMDTLSMGMDTLGGGGGGGGKNLISMLVAKEKNNSPNSDPEPSANAIRLSMLLFSLIKERDPKAKEPDLQKWAMHIDRLIRIDQRTPEEIEIMIRWCQCDDFWQNNILSTEKLRKQFTSLTLKMNKVEGRQPEDAFDKRLAQLKKMREK